MEQPAYYAIVPANVRYAGNLSEFQKLLFWEITALTDKFWYCFAPNSYFAGLYGKTPKWISATIWDMEKKGFLEIQYEWVANSKRKIFVWEISFKRVKSQKTTLPEKQEGDPRKKGYTLPEKQEHINTRLSILYNERNISENLGKKITEFIEHRREIKRPLTERSIIATIKKCAEAWEALSIITIDRTIENSWQGLIWDKDRGGFARKPPRNAMTEDKDYSAGLGQFSTVTH